MKLAMNAIQASQGAIKPQISTWLRFACWGSHGLPRGESRSHYDLPPSDKNHSLLVGLAVQISDPRNGSEKKPPTPDTDC